jgi:myosin heavy subunit
MEGVQEDNQFGISYRTIQKVFHLLNLRVQQQRAAEMFVGAEEGVDEPAKEVKFEFTIKVGMLEIYNDEIYDLLNTAGASMAEKKKGAMAAGGKGSLDIRRNKEGRIEVPGLAKESVGTIEEVMALLKRGNSNRATAATDMNEHSSRSHMVLMVDVVSGLEDAQSNKGTLYLVDLAGSERVRKSNVEGDQLKEAGFINKSLSALGNVMEALDRKASHVPYRDSKLTYMLQDSLGGNSRTMMVVAICPNDHSFDESVHALGFATRVRRIQIGAAKRNVTSKNLEETVKSLTEEMRTLARAKERTEGQLHTLKRDNTRVQEKLENLNENRKQSRSDSKTLEVLRKNNDDMAARWQKEKQSREESSEELETIRKELRSVQQQLGKSKTKMQGLERTLEDKEHALEIASKQLLDARNNKSAATARARRDQVLSARKRHPPSQTPSLGPALPPVRTTTPAPSPSKPATTASASVATDRPAAPAVHQQEEEGSESEHGDASDVRAKVLSLLEKHDPVKADRIDIIMEKFSGKEALLLEKMTQRYEGGSTTQDSFQKRNELSVQRHQDRMKRIREKKEQGN